jgi:hypothetical protein
MWYVQDEGTEVVGPVTTELLLDGIRAGRVPESAQLCPVGGTAWTRATAIPLFAAAFPSSMGTSGAPGPGHVMWYVQDEGTEVVGPVTTELLLDGIRAGRVPESAQLCPVGGTAWTRATAIPLFAAAFPSSMGTSGAPGPGHVFAVPGGQANSATVLEPGQPQHRAVTVPIRPATIAIPGLLVLGLLSVGALVGYLAGHRDSPSSARNDALAVSATPTPTASSVSEPKKPLSAPSLAAVGTEMPIVTILRLPFREAVDFAKPKMHDIDCDLAADACVPSGGAILLAGWAVQRIQWSDVSGPGETSFAQIKREPRAERGKRLCLRGTIVRIGSMNVMGRAWEGLLGADDEAAHFLAVGDSGDLKRGDHARICGVATGVMRTADAHGIMHLADIVGVFDLPANRRIHRVGDAP